MAYLSEEEQRRRIIEVAKEKGVDCPDMVVEAAMAVMGKLPGQVNYRCTEDAGLEYLDLTREEAEYVGIDLSAPGGPEAAGYPHR